MSLRNKGSFQVNGSEFPAKSINVSYESIASEDSGRTDDGVMHINWVMRRVRKVSITLPPQDATGIALVLNAVQGKEYNLTYWDVLANAEKTIHVYTSTSSASMYSGVLYNGLWQDVTFNAIEVAGEN